MKKLLSRFLIPIALLLISSSSAKAENKIGINIGADHGRFEDAANLVGSGGWVVVMACPSDGDKIARWVQDYPQINLVIRGHFFGQTLNENLARLWTATLQSIPTPNKIYFMPWNEPNHELEGGGPTFGNETYGYGEKVVEVFRNAGILDSKVIVLSPMVDKLNPSFIDGSFFTNPGGKYSFYSLFSGSSINEYDQFAPGPCSASPPQNNCRYDELGIPGPFYALEAGVAGTCTPPCYRDNELRAMLDESWKKWGGDSGFKMFAIFSYDPHRPGSWDIFSSSQTRSFLENHRGGPCCTQSIPPTSSTPSLNPCPGKNHTFYINSEAECTECGGVSSLLYCKPLPADNFGEEYSKEIINLSEKVYRAGSEANVCNIRQFTAQATASDVSIPFAYQLNQYFLGPYLDNLGARVGKNDLDPINDYGAFEKLAPKKLQDQLKQEFLDHVSHNPNTRYQNFSIQGVSANMIKPSMEAIWAQVPLFANEESEGEIVFEGPGISGIIKTSVPEVYRLNKVTTKLAQMLGVPQGETKGEKTQTPQILQAADSCPLEKMDPRTSNKETQTGPSSAVCSQDDIQTDPQANLLGERHFDQSIFESKDAGSCQDKTVNSCCQTGKKCLPDPTYTEGLCTEITCYCGNCGGSCHDEQGNVWSECKIKESEHKFDLAISIKNRVPFLKKIAENTVGEKGFFRPFKPYSQDEQKQFEQAFNEVAGESAANISLAKATSVVGPIEVDIKTSSNPISLLFHKIGTMINVKDLVSGIVLWPHSPLSEFINPPSEPTTLTYTIDFRNPNIGVTAKDQVMQMVLSNWPNSKISSQWNYVYAQAQNHGWNPAFVIALWIEESGASGVSFRQDLNREVYDLGCLGGEPNNLASQLECLFSRPYANQSFADFMCMYSEGKSSPCEFALNPNFPRNLKIWYDRLTQ